MNQTNEYTSSNLDKHQCQHPFAMKRIGRFYDSLVKLIALVNASNVLNVGCGEGFDFKSIYERGEIDFEYCCGLDLNFEALKMAKKISTKLRFNAIKGDIYSLPFKLNRFDLLLCLEVLEHLAFPERALNELSQHFNGHCIFSVPNEPLYRLARLLIFGQNIRHLGNHPEHINHWSKHEFSRLIREYFVIDQILTPFPWTIVLCHQKK